MHPGPSQEETGRIAGKRLTHSQWDTNHPTIHPTILQTILKESFLDKDMRYPVKVMSALCETCKKKCNEKKSKRIEWLKWFSKQKKPNNHIQPQKVLARPNICRGVLLIPAKRENHYRVMQKKMCLFEYHC